MRQLLIRFMAVVTLLLVPAGLSACSSSQTAKNGAAMTAGKATDVSAIEPAAGAPVKNLPRTTDQARGATY